ncbi:MAG: hypothetical protein ABSF16_17625 [Terracidiphilus sp.]|jgi:hypothetical protein
MKPAQMGTLKFFSLLFLLPGLAGLIVSAMISTHYLDTLPKWPAPDQMRITPRNIHGTVVYQTVEEDSQLNLLEYSSVGIFLLGLGLGVVYLAKWGIVRALGADDEELDGHLGESGKSGL